MRPLEVVVHESVVVHATVLRLGMVSTLSWELSRTATVLDGPMSKLIVVMPD